MYKLCLTKNINKFKIHKITHIHMYSYIPNSLNAKKKKEKRFASVKEKYFLLNRFSYIFYEYML
jgi:hypothetical protein